MRILHLIDTGGPGGAETIYSELARGLAERGHSSLTVVPELNWLSANLEGLGFSPILLEARAMDVRYVRRLRRLIVEEQIDIVQAHLLGAGVYAAMTCLGTEVPSVSTFHGRPDIDEHDTLLPIKTRLLNRVPNRVVCVSNSLASHFQELGYFPRPPLVIPNGVDLDTFRASGPSDLRAELELAEDDVLIGAVGNVRRSKAYPDLLKAFALVRQNVPQAHLVIAGHYDEQGSLCRELNVQIRDLSLGSHVHLLGFRADAAAVLHAIDLFILSSRDEGFSLATVQALALGLPSVLTRSGGPEEIVGDSSGAVLVPPANPEAMASGIIQVLELSEDSRTAMARRGQVRVRETYSRSRMVDQYEALYEQLLD